MGTELSAGTWLRHGLCFPLSWVKSTPVLELGIKMCHSSPRWHSGKPFLPSVLLLYFSCLARLKTLFYHGQSSCCVGVITPLTWCLNTQNMQGKKGCPRFPRTSPMIVLSKQSARSSCRYFIFSSYPVQNSLIMMCSCQAALSLLPAEQWTHSSLVGKPSMCPGIGSG